MKSFGRVLAGLSAVAGLCVGVNADEQVPEDQVNLTVEATVEDERPEAVTIRRSGSGTLTVESDGVARTITLDQKDDEESADGQKPKREVVVIQKSEVRTQEDGEEPHVKVDGKVIVIGPDGEKKEYSLDSQEGQAIRLRLSDGEKEGDSRLVERAIILKGNRLLDEKDDDEDHEDGEDQDAAEEERFVIGVQCDEASDLLRKHLKLSKNGVVVVDVREETPAAAAGLKQDDIITAIDDKPLGSREQLVTAVTESEGRELKFSVIREGEPTSVQITPVKMKVPVVVAPAEVNLEDLKALAVPGRLHRVHPGVLLQGMPENGEALSKVLESLRSNQNFAWRDLEEDKEELEESVQELRGQVSDMKKALDELREELKKSAGER